MSASGASTIQPNTPVPGVQTPANIPLLPSLGEGISEHRNTVDSHSTGSEFRQEEAQGVIEGTKLGKRRLFGFGKKKNDEKGHLRKESDTVQPVAAVGNVIAPIAPIARRVMSIPSGSPPRSNPNNPYQAPSSPQRNLYSSSPRIISPAGSQIFERDVQENSLPVPNSPAIPLHIQTENHIPAVLDASSEAITNDSLNPDSVEIVMHSAHQPAANVTGVVEQSWWADDLISHQPDRDDSASNYGALDNADVRRLSFISFSDIVQSEHAEHVGNRDSIYVAGLSSFSSGHNRSPSPIRSPVSSQGFDTTPPTSKSASIKGGETSPRGKSVGSPISNHPSSAGGEVTGLTVETMSQALRRTGSGDLSGYRSQPLSPSSPDEPHELRS